MPLLLIHRLEVMPLALLVQILSVALAIFSDQLYFCFKASQLVLLQVGLELILI